MKKITAFTLFIALLFSCNRAIFRPENAGRCDAVNRGDFNSRIRPPFERCWQFMASSAPGVSITALDSLLFIGTKNGHVYAVCTETGKTQWSRRYPSKYETTCVPGEKLLYIALRYGEKTLDAIDYSTGKIVWQQNAGYIEGEPLIVRDRIYIGNEQGRLICMDTNSGCVIWSQNLDAPVRGSLCASDSLVFASVESGLIHAVTKADGHPVWKTDLNASLQTGPLYYHGRLYAGTNEGEVYCCDAFSGQTIWQTQVTGSIYQKCSMDSNAVYIGTSQGILYAMQPDSGAVLWQFETGSVIGTSVAISNGWLYFGTLDKMLIAVNSQQINEVWKNELDGRVRTMPLIYQDRLFVGSENRHVYGFKPAK